MKIAIHNSTNSFAQRWIAYCENNNINYKIVNCYDSDIVSHLEDCDALMWHFHHMIPKDILMAKQLLYSLEQSGKHVFPDFATMWHFDDKLGQKYLLESIKAPLVPTYVFFDIKILKEWAEKTTYPKVFKLRGGAGSANVKLINNKKEMLAMASTAFGKGFSFYNSWENLKERIRKYKLGKTDLWDIVKGILRFFKQPPYATINGNEKGYLYLQDFIPQNTFDIRVIVIKDKAFAIKRNVREGDFRASGSGFIQYEKEHFDDSLIAISFEIANNLNSKCVAFDFVYDKDTPLLVEVSYGFAKQGYDDCVGYWDNQLKWYEGKFNPYGWMVDNLLSEIAENKKSFEEVENQ